nr:hypothetical protein KPHV_22540 [Kitasatospora purpeofusca]
MAPGASVYSNILAAMIDGEVTSSGYGRVWLKPANRLPAHPARYDRATTGGKAASAIAL